MEYRYDAQGNRLRKAPIGGEFPSDVYVRDASGNVLAVYEKQVFFGDVPVNRIKEFHLYGSSRHGMIKADRVIHPEEVSDPLFTRSLRQEKSYELMNHLGNVLVTLSDKKLGRDTNDDGIVNRYHGITLSEVDYYPCLPAGRPLAWKCPAEPISQKTIDLDSMGRRKILTSVHWQTMTMGLGFIIPAYRQAGGDWEVFECGSADEELSDVDSVSICEQ